MEAPKITFYNRQTDLALSLKSLRKAIRAVLSHLCILTDEVIIHFVTEKKIRFLHHLFFNDDSLTDCISVPIDPPVKKKVGYHILGEMFICAKVAKDYAQKHAISHKSELLRYIIHCLLHLIGYDDITEKDRRKMKKKEEECLNLLGNF